MAVAKYQCGIAYAPCNGTLPWKPLPLLPPASICVAIASSCSDQELVSVSASITRSTSATRVVSPVCAPSGSLADSTSTNAMLFLPFPTLADINGNPLYGRCEAYSSSYTTCLSAVGAGSLVYIGSGLSQQLMDQYAAAQFTSYNNLNLAAPQCFQLLKTLICRATFSACDQQAIANYFIISPSIISAALPKAPCLTDCNIVVTNPVCSLVTSLVNPVCAQQANTFDCSGLVTSANFIFSAATSFPPVPVRFAGPENDVNFTNGVATVSVTCLPTASTYPTLAPTSATPTVVPTTAPSTISPTLEPSTRAPTFAPTLNPSTKSPTSVTLNSLSHNNSNSPNNPNNLGCALIDTYQRDAHGFIFYIVSHHDFAFDFSHLSCPYKFPKLLS
jgi:hypothetical protein